MLARCLGILDPEMAFQREEYDPYAPRPTDPEGLRRLAELQSCLRLMTMNELMRRLWRDGQLDAAQSEAAVNCLRAIMVQPAVAMRLLADLATRVLGLAYPERPPRRRRGDSPPRPRAGSRAAKPSRARPPAAPGEPDALAGE
ncbi:hypothetical protein [Amaricoccus sp.]|uniref:hypothetical protein n=1 Tax=Amaricoccus sp. TaxID=1872485 RepID=UPI001B5F7E93|nr:hypothetical protein [Amaricoccus sp.]MBP7241451.1 hypothetical protein [Amaricoccus sp.]